MYGPASHQQYGMPPPQQTGSMMGSAPSREHQSNPSERNDIFVGNLAFSTTEEQLHTIFSEVGKLVKIRMVSDSETGKPRGFAFVEYEDPQAALSAIRNLNDYELNGRRIRVNFSNSSHLETLAGKLGMDMQSGGHNTSNNDSTQHHNAQQSSLSSSTSFIDDGGAQAVADALKSLTKSEMYDVIAQLKSVADKDADEARRLLCAHPQLPEAILHLMSKLNMIQSPLPTSTLAVGSGMNVVSQQQVQPVVRKAPSDPRAAMRAGASDPRAAARVDPRAALQQQPPAVAMNMPPRPVAASMAQQARPPMQQQQGQFMPVSTGVAPAAPAAPKLDPNLVQQVMSLTQQQIAVLPPDKQQSILELRQKIMTGQL
eukprot:CAMPEP_0196813274 /NCGR_PEP_ID=MMETSP1362-20130617/35284_1 /TAXON_ID=163516 /ORGANISM="Leptocylindrus danicus, Strain CCMP1856" /LENGTH=370 /DNA_ID=CAMNT_0042189393 /DNA_START=38 /DNA_END=1150 /DNA_ORIENTATION=+